MSIEWYSILKWKTFHCSFETTQRSPSIWVVIYKLVWPTTECLELCGHFNCQRIIQRWKACCKTLAENSFTAIPSLRWNQFTSGEIDKYFIIFHFYVQLRFSNVSLPWIYEIVWWHKSVIVNINTPFWIYLMEVYTFRDLFFSQSSWLGPLCLWRPEAWTAGGVYNGTRNTFGTDAQHLNSFTFVWMTWRPRMGYSMR